MSRFQDMPGRGLLASRWPRHLWLVAGCSGLGWVLYPTLARGPLRLDLFGQLLQLHHPSGLLGLLALPWLLLVWLEASTTSLNTAFLAQGIVRAVTWLVLCVAICDPQWLGPPQPSAIVVLSDRSRSIHAEEQAQAKQFITKLKAGAQGREVHLLEFAAAPVEPNAQHNPLSADQTDIERALNLALFSPVTAATRRVVLLSDGLSTRGDPHLAATVAAQQGVPIDVVPLLAPAPADAALAAMELPDRVPQGQRFSLYITVQSNHAMPATVTLVRMQGRQEFPVSSQQVRLNRGETSLTFSDVATREGSAHYRCQLVTEGPDRLSENNRIEGDLEIVGPSRVLLIDRTPSHLSALATSLSVAHFESDLRTPTGLSSRPSDLRRFAAIVLSNLNRSDLSSTQISALSQYARDGGCILFSGGDRSIVQDDAQDPLARLLPTTSHGTQSEDEASAALALVIDASGSMAGEKLDLAKAAAVSAVQLLNDDDLIEVIGFAGSPQRIVRLQPASNRHRIEADIQRLLPHGGTALFPALELAYQDLSMTHAVLKHAVLLTDGQTDETGLTTLAHLLRGEGITLSTVGLGDDVQRELLANLANLTGGRSHLTSDPSAVPRIFMQETSRVRHSTMHEGRFRMRKGSHADSLQGLPLDLAPALRGHGAVHPKPHAQVVLVHDDGHPLLVRKRLGLGWVLAWTSDLTARWSAELLRWPKFPQFIGQLLAAHAHTQQLQRVQLEANLEHDTFRVTSDVTRPDGDGVNDLTGSLQVRSTTYSMRQTGPGHYETRVPAPMVPGSMPLQVHFSHGADLVAEGHGYARRLYPTELAPNPPNLELLRNLSRRTGGIFQPTPSDILTAVSRLARRQTRPLHLPLIGAALGLFLIELTLRQRRR